LQLQDGNGYDEPCGQLVKVETATSCLWVARIDAPWVVFYGSAAGIYDL
jgi:hypothetical protein